jgi:hypothetical protein
LDVCNALGVCNLAHKELKGKLVCILVDKQVCKLVCKSAVVHTLLDKQVVEHMLAGRQVRKLVGMQVHMLCLVHHIAQASSLSGFLAGNLAHLRIDKWVLTVHK